MKVSAYDKMVAELTKCGWRTLPLVHKVWVSMGSFKEYREADKELTKLKASGIECSKTHTNYKGYTVWAEGDGIVLRVVRPATYRWTGDFRMVAEFTPEGTFIRGYSHSDTPYVPSGYRYGGKRSIGESLKELMHLIQVSSPENMAKLKEGDLQGAKDKLQNALTKKAEYEARVEKTKQEVLSILACPTSLEGAIERILRGGILVLPFYKEYREEDIEDAKKELEKLQE